MHIASAEPKTDEGSVGWPPYIGGRTLHRLTLSLDPEEGL